MSARRNGKKVNDVIRIEDLAAEFVTALATELKGLNDVHSLRDNDLLLSIFNQSYEGVKDIPLKNEIRSNTAKYYEKFLDVFKTPSILKSKSNDNCRILLGNGAVELDKVGWSLNFHTSNDFLGLIAKVMIEEYNDGANIHKLESEEYINMILSKLSIVSPGNICHEAIGCLASYCVVQAMKQNVNNSHFNIKNIIEFLNHDDIMNFFTTIGYLKYWYSKLSRSKLKNIDFIIEILEQILLIFKTIVYKKNKLSDSSIIVFISKKINIVVVCLLLLYTFISDIKESNKSAANVCGKLLQVLSSYFKDVTSGFDASKFWETLILPSITKIDDRNMKQLLLLVELSINKADVSTTTLFLQWFSNDKNAQSILQLLLENLVTSANDRDSEDTVLVANSDNLMNEDPVEAVEFEIDTSATIIETLDNHRRDNENREEVDEDNDLMVKEINNKRNVGKRKVASDGIKDVKIVAKVAKVAKKKKN